MVEPLRISVGLKRKVQLVEHLPYKRPTRGRIRSDTHPRVWPKNNHNKKRIPGTTVCKRRQAPQSPVINEQQQREGKVGGGGGGEEETRYWDKVKPG